MRSTSGCESGTGFPGRADEAGHAGRVLDEAPYVVVQIHVDEHVARPEPALGLHLLPVLGLDDGLGGHDDPADTAPPSDIDFTRCSRLVLTLFSWPETVLITYQRKYGDLFQIDELGGETGEHLVRP